MRATTTPRRLAQRCGEEDAWRGTAAEGRQREGPQGCLCLTTLRPCIVIVARLMAVSSGRARRPPPGDRPQWGQALPSRRRSRPPSPRRRPGHLQACGRTRRPRGRPARRRQARCRTRAALAGGPGDTGRGDAGRPRHRQLPRFPLSADAWPVPRAVAARGADRAHALRRGLARRWY